MSGSFPSRVVGQAFELTKPAVTTVQLVQYAGASLDFNRIHYDLPFAMESGLPGVIAHGMLTMGFMAQCATTWAGPGARVARISARFTAPVRPGDSVRIRGTVKAKQDDGRLDCELTAQVGDKTVASGEVSLQWNFR